MTFWFFPTVLSREAQSQAFAAGELALAAEGLPDVARAHSVAQIKERLRLLAPELPPEQIDERAGHFWRLGHEVLAGDHAVLVSGEDSGLMIGEVGGAVRLETRNGHDFHVLPVDWIEPKLLSLSLPTLIGYLKRGVLVEITDADMLERLKSHIPSLHRRRHAVFKWFVFAVLLVECLLHFRPK